MSTIGRLKELGLINPPSFVPANTQYETIMGSVAYGVSSDTSDMDVYGFCIPPKDIIFPHLAGEIAGFGTQAKRFEQFQEHHINDKSALGGNGRVYDVTVYSIVKYFQLCMENNPNMIDSLFTPANCVLHITRIGNLVRDQRKIFLHKGAWHKFKGYAYSQLHRMSHEVATGKRVELIEKFGYDVKFAYHVVRLLNEVEQIMIEGDIDLQRNREQLKSIRRGEWKESEIKDYFTAKEKELETIYTQSKLPPSPDERAIKRLLLDCLEEHYGNLGDCIVNPDEAVQALREIKATLDRVQNLL